jgi:hypothetical protein
LYGGLSGILGHDLLLNIVSCPTVPPYASAYFWDCLRILVSYAGMWHKWDRLFCSSHCPIYALVLAHFPGGGCVAAVGRRSERRGRLTALDKMTHRSRSRKSGSNSVMQMGHIADKHVLRFYWLAMSIKGVVTFTMTQFALIQSVSISLGALASGSLLQIKIQGLPHFSLVVGM